MQPGIPEENEVLNYFKTLSNWNRWGSDDQLGTLNYLSETKTLNAIREVKHGKTISCARTISWEPSPDSQIPPVHFMVESGEGWENENKISNRKSQASTDYFGLIFHGHTITHMDSLAHFFWNGRAYNNQPSHLVSTSMGATIESIELAKEGIITRGILVDIPLLKDIEWLNRGVGVMPEDIIEAEKKFDFKIQSGDVLLVRTGQLHRRNTEGAVDPRVEGSTACQAACLPLLHEREISILGSDTGNDVMPQQYKALTNPIHQIGIVGMGLWILDNANLEELAKECKKRKQWSFLINILPLRLQNTTGSPVNPIAVF